MKKRTLAMIGLAAGSLLRRARPVLVLALITGAQALSATTLIVGNCKSGGYSTIQGAINKAPAGAIVQVCPGTYSEQVSITRAVTLEGISSNGTDMATIAPPANGLTQTAATDIPGFTVAYQVWVNNSPGAVNISNIFLDGRNNLVPSCAPAIAGIYYQNSHGTINGVTASSQSGNRCGVGIWVEGGSSNPSVTVENSVVISFDYLGIFAETTFEADTQLTAKITNNELFAIDVCYAGIVVESGTTSTVTKNFLELYIGPYGGFCNYGIFIAPSAAGSVSANTVENYGTGIGANADGVPVTSNNLLSNGTGINVQTTVAAIKQNSVFESGIGIEFNCIANPNVLSNIINWSNTGLDQVPSALGTSTNKVFNTTTVRTGGC